MDFHALKLSPLGVSSGRARGVESPGQDPHFHGHEAQRSSCPLLHVQNMSSGTKSSCQPSSGDLVFFLVTYSVLLPPSTRCPKISFSFSSKFSRFAQQCLRVVRSRSIFLVRGYVPSTCDFKEGFPEPWSQCSPPDSVPRTWGSSAGHPNMSCMSAPPCLSSMPLILSLILLYLFLTFFFSRSFLTLMFNYRSS